MSNDEILVGSRWRWNGTSEGRFWQVTGHAGGSVFMVASDGGSTCTAITSFRNATRIDAPPAVKVGDVVRDPALLRDGIKVKVRIDCAENPVVVLSGRTSWGWNTDGGEWVVTEVAAREGRITVVSLPGPAKAEAPEVVTPPPPERCAPDCTPAAPCWAGSTDDGGCPAWREGVPGAPRIDCHGVAADLPPASRHTPPTLRHEGLCIAGWNGRVPRG